MPRTQGRWTRPRILHALGSSRVRSTAWTPLHLQYEREVAEVLGIPGNVRQGVLLPVAYTKGTDFKPAPRNDLDSVVHLNGW